MTPVAGNVEAVKRRGVAGVSLLQAADVERSLDEGAEIDRF